jgi:hypothetical protein
MWWNKKLLGSSKAFLSLPHTTMNCSRDLIDGKKCFEKLRALRWTYSRPNACPQCTSKQISIRGRTIVIQAAGGMAV